MQPAGRAKILLDYVVDSRTSMQIHRQFKGKPCIVSKIQGPVKMGFRRPKATVATLAGCRHRGLAPRAVRLAGGAPDS